MEIRMPDQTSVIFDSGAAITDGAQRGISLSCDITPDKGLKVSVKADQTPLQYILLRWNFSDGDLPSGSIKVLGDEWERAYGTMEWRSINPDVYMPWYFFITNSSDRAETSDRRTCAFGVKVRPNALCFWNLDSAGVTLWLDVRNGTRGVVLGGKTLEAATVVFGDYSGMCAFVAAQSFCRAMCADGIFPKEPVYGSNNWYYAYGNSSHEEIVRDASIVAECTKGLKTRPYMVIDDGWQPNSCDGPWHCGSAKFPDMKRLAAEISAMDVKPGIWIRFLADIRRASPDIKDEWRLGRDASFLDPSRPEVIAHVKADTKRIADWGYKLIKHDYSTHDIFGDWGMNRPKSLAGEPQAGREWSFWDTSRTSAEIVLDFYRAIREAAGDDTVIIGCNTISHLCAGLVEVNRTGDDTSGKDWFRTRKFGVNTLAFRLPQNNIFYKADADCVGITELIPWEKNRLWLKALAVSGSPLFVSCKPGVLNAEQEAELKEAFAVNSVQTDTLIPLDWTETTCPQKWLHNGEVITFPWFE